MIKPNAKLLQARHVKLKITMLLKIFVCVTVNGNVPKFMDGRDVAMDLIAIVANNVETLT